MPPIKSSSNWLPWSYAGITCLVQIVVITLSLLPNTRTLPLVVGDVPSYLIPAENLASTGAFSREDQSPYLWEPYRTPGYPLLIAASIRLFGDFRLTLYLSALAAGAAAWCIVRLAQLLEAGPGGQHTAGWLAALLPNALGLSAQLLTDAIFGYLVTGWVLLLVNAYRQKSITQGLTASILLAAIQTIKPSLNLAWALLFFLLILFARSRRAWLAGLLVILLSLPVPAYFAYRNMAAHGVPAASLLGIATAREYLQVRDLQQASGQDYETVTWQVRESDLQEADHLSSPTSRYGRLYLVQQKHVREFLTSRPIDAARLMLTEMIRQFAAPQEFVFQVFFGDLPSWARAAGSLLTLLIYAAAFIGAARAIKQKEIFPVVMAVMLLGYFLLTGSISHMVGGRLRFPADLAALPFTALGLDALTRRS